MSHPSAASGQIKIKHGKRENDLFICNGEGTSKADAHLLLGAVKDRVLQADFETSYRLEVEGKMTDSVLAQLEARGYDPTTLEISIRKKPGASS
jgi:hypothetical protein